MKIGFLLKLVLFFLISTLLVGLFGVFTGAFPGDPPHPNGETTDVDLAPPRRVILDPGHGGEDGGASSAAGLVEKDVNLSIAFLLRDMLEANGIEVILTREDDRLLYDRSVDFQGRKKKLDFAARLRIMEENPDAVLVSIHMNSFSDPRYSGLQVWYSENHSESPSLADLIQGNAKALLQPDNDRKTKAAGSTILLLDKAKQPAVLVECGFLSNPAEAARLESTEYRQSVAFVIFTSLTEFFEVRG